MERKQLDEVFKLAITAKIQASNVRTRISGKIDKEGELTTESRSFLEISRAVDNVCEAIRILTM